jgi:hypothetical protein
VWRFSFKRAGARFGGQDARAPGFRGYCPKSVE